MSTEAYIPSFLDLPEVSHDEIPDIPTQIKNAEQAALKRNEELRLLVVQEAMELELIKAGITQTIVNAYPDDFSGVVTARFYPVRQVAVDRTHFLVGAQTNKYDATHGFAIPHYRFVNIGFEKDGEYIPIGGNEVEHVIRLASMIGDLIGRKESGELPNLDFSCTMIQDF